MKKLFTAFTFILFLLPSFASAAVVASYAGSTVSFFGFGQTGVVKVAQEFTFSGGTSYKLTSATGQTRLIGSPGDSCNLSLYSDTGSNVPNALIETSGNVTCSSGSTDTTFTFAGTNTMAPSTNYWLVMTRTGSADDSNRYGWDYGTTGLTQPTQVKYWDGSAWQNDAGTGFNTIFSVSGTAVAAATSFNFWQFFGF